MRTSNPLYLYCIRPKIRAKFSATGIDRKVSARALPYRDLEAIVSHLNPKEWNVQEFIKRAEEDVAWIKEMAEIHEGVVEEAMGLSGKQRLIIPVIPMKFGTIFENRKNLEKVLATQHGKFKALLKKLEEKAEWHVKVYLADTRTFEKELASRNQGVQTRKKEMASMNKGAAYFVEKEIEAIVKKGKEKALNDFTGYVFEILARSADEGVRGKILAKELTGRSEPMVANGTFLISKEKINGFQKTVGHLKEEFPAFEFVSSGPWPPYHFV